jgi:LmbE family N-acetylglucosaminyl deacetylase
MVRAVGHRTWTALRKQARRLDEARLRALSPMLIVAPHQDDETLGCGGLIATASALGLRPRVAYLTDGAASHEGSRAWPPQRLAERRRREAIAALDILGVDETDILFLDWADAAPLAAGDEAYVRSLDGLARWAAAFAPRSLWSTWRGEAHCDHAAAAALADDLLRRLPGPPARMEYLVWGWQEARLAAEAGRAWGLDCRQTIAARQQALACHQTQTTGLIDDAPGAFRIPPRLAALTGRPTEIFLGAA